MLRAASVKALLLSTLVFTGLSLAPGTASAQTDLSVSLIAQGGYSIATRSGAKNSGETAQLANFQLSADMSNAPTVSGGVSVGLGDTGFAFNGIFRTTVGAEMSSQILLCGIIPDPQLCRTIDVEMERRDYLLEAIYVRPGTGMVRPVFNIGIGVRDFAAGTLPTCPTRIQDPTPWPEVCEKGVDIYRDTSPTSLLTFGFGGLASVGRLGARADASVAYSRYTGGVDTAVGTQLLEVILEAGFTLRVF